MKKNVLSLLFTGVMLLLPATQTGCDQGSGDLSFTRGEYRYVVDPLTGKVSIFSKDGALQEIYHSPAAGPEQKESPIPSHIIHYLLPGKGTISGLVWNDINGNRTLDADESTLQDITVYLDADGSETFTPGDPFELTDANGFYAFAKIKSGITNIYIDSDTLPDGYRVTTSNPITVSLARNQTAESTDFGVQNQSAKISGTVRDQTDNVPVAGVVVGLFDNDGESPVIEKTNTTDASGRFLFSNLPGGDYYVYVDTASLDGKYLQTPVSGSDPTQIMLQPGGSLSVNFSYAQKATISGVARDASGAPLGFIRVFIDLNGNGVYDEGEPLTATNEFGNYIFNELVPGTYTVMILMPNGYSVLASPGTITIGAGDNYTAANFLAQAQPVSIAGYVWDDNNGNGLRDALETGLAGITVFLDSNNSGSLEGGELSMATDATGAYSFTDLLHGDFYIRVSDLALLNAYIPTTTPNPVHRVISAGQSYDGARFGYQSKLATLHTLLYPLRLTWGNEGNLYVSDNANGSVYIYDSTLDIKGELKGLAKPLGVAIDNTGNIYVGNEGRKNVEVYDSSGNLLRTIGDGYILKPNDLAVDRYNNLYVLDSANDAVLVYDLNGAALYTIGNSTILDYAVSIAISYRDDGSGSEVGELYIADQANCTIHVFSLGGTYKKFVGTRGTQMTKIWDGKFSGLMAVDIDQYGNIHGLDNSLNVVQVFEPQNGTFLRSYNAYPVENENRLNLQMDLGINPADSRVVISNIATKNVETVTTVTVP